jgi:hypothetical protein
VHSSPGPADEHGELREMVAAVALS